MKFKCVAHIDYEFAIEADSREDAEINAFERLADDVTQGTIRTDLFDECPECFPVPMLRAVDVLEAAAPEENSNNMEDRNMEIIGLDALVREIHKNARDHGWWDEERSLPEILMLCVSELAEALEEYRNGKPLLYTNCNGLPYCAEDETAPDCKECPPPKPEGVAVELADCMIRILDYCGYAGIDIAEAIRLKHKYNKSRPYRHGGKKC